MRVLFHVEPLVMHSRPFHYWAWLDRVASMGRLLRTRGWECRWAMNYALGSRAVAPFDPDERPHTQRGQGLGAGRVDGGTGGAHGGDVTGCVAGGPGPGAPIDAAVH